MTKDILIVILAFLLVIGIVWAGVFFWQLTFRG